MLVSVAGQLANGSADVTPAQLRSFTNVGLALAAPEVLPRSGKKVERAELAPLSNTAGGGRRSDSLIAQRGQQSVKVFPHGPQAHRCAAVPGWCCSIGQPRQRGEPHPVGRLVLYAAEVAAQLRVLVPEHQ